MQHIVDNEPLGSAPPAPLPEPQARVFPLRRGADPAPAKRPAAPDGDDSAPPSASTQRSHAPRGWRPTAQCTWCRLGALRPDVLDELHALHVHQGLGARALVQVAGRRLGPSERVPSARSMSRHVHHIDRGAYVSTDDEDQLAADDGEVGWLPAELSELWKIHRRLDRQIKKLDAALAVTSEGGEPDLNRIAQLAGLANADRSTLLAISKMRGAADTTVQAITFALRTLLQGYSDAVVSALEEIIRFAEARGATGVADRIRTVAAPRGQIATAAMKAANQALEATIGALGIEWRPPPTPPS